MDVEIVTVFNRKDVYDRMCDSALHSCKTHTIKFIGMDNTANRYSSAAQAYNIALSNSCFSDVIILCHQDIVFSQGVIDEIVAACMSDKNSVFGAAGAILRDTAPHNEIISAICEGKDKRYTTLQYGEMRDVFSLDECLLAARRSIFGLVRFDERTCDGWHFYGVDFCLECRKNGISVRVLGMDITHLSNGHRDKSYRCAEKQLAQKWGKSYELLAYTTGWTYTKLPLRQLLRGYRLLKGLK